MAGKLSHVGAGYALDIATGRAAGPGVRSMYLALLTAAPTAATTMGTMVEATFTYTRPLVEWDAPSGTPRLTDNTNEETIGPLADADGTEAVTHWALVSAQVGTVGDLVAYGDWTTPRTPNVNDTLRVAAGDLDISID